MILERLLIETDLRVLILDPNSDFVHLGQVRAGADPALAGRPIIAVRDREGRYRALVARPA